MKPTRSTASRWPRERHERSKAAQQDCANRTGYSEVLLQSRFRWRCMKYRTSPAQAPSEAASNVRLQPVLCLTNNTPIDMNTPKPTERNSIFAFDRISTSSRWQPWVARVAQGCFQVTGQGFR